MNAFETILFSYTTRLVFSVMVGLAIAYFSKSSIKRMSKDRATQQKVLWGFTMVMVVEVFLSENWVSRICVLFIFLPAIIAFYRHMPESR